jgi:hypothetical protein
MKIETSNIEVLMPVTEAMPFGELFFTVLCAVTGLIGGNIVIAMHYKRMGQHWASGFKPFAFPFKNFNGTEWFNLLLVSVITMLFAAMASTFSN